MNAYAASLKRYLEAERALVAASEPVSSELVYEHHASAEYFRTIRGIFAASLSRSAALDAVESWDVTESA
jgi:hypothetical protein